MNKNADELAYHITIISPDREEKHDFVIYDRAFRKPLSVSEIKDVSGVPLTEENLIDITNSQIIEGINYECEQVFVRFLFVGFESRNAISWTIVAGVNPFNLKKFQDSKEEEYGVVVVTSLTQLDYEMFVGNGGDPLGYRG